MKTYYNAALDILVRFTSSTEFVVIGDESKVSDDTLLALSSGSLPEGWRTSSVDGTYTPVVHAMYRALEESNG